MAVTDRFESLIREAQRQPFTGWDFSWLGDRMITHDLPWNFAAIVADRARHAPDLLDLGTGGGERLAALPRHPPLTVATESWLPNVPVAAHRLRPLGVHVVQVDGTPDIVRQVPGKPDAGLPLRDGSFHLVVSRHTAYVPAELARILVPGGRFLTQQVGYGIAAAFHRLLGLPEPVDRAPRLTRSFAARQLEVAGLDVVDGGEGVQRYEFRDVGAMVWCLKAIAPFTVPGFTVEAFRSQLACLHEQLVACGAVSVGHVSFWIEAVRR